MEKTIPILMQAARDARGLAMDAVAQAASGHLGLPLGAAEIGAALFGHCLSYHPRHPRWLNRDRFVLSAGHGSMFLYAWLHLAGYDLSLDDLKQFRQLHSKTPGHPEFHETPGVECTTGPLGQGIGNAVGLAVSGKMAAAHFNTADYTIFDYHVVALAGDGCMQEGVASEACAYAAHVGLDNLIIIYDSNDVTLDAAGSKSQSENTALRFQAYGFDVETIDGHDIKAIFTAFSKAKQNKNGKPKLIIAKTKIGQGIPEVAGTCKAHGEAGVKFVPAARQALGLPDERFFVSPETKAYFKSHQQIADACFNTWQVKFEAWQKAEPARARALHQGLGHFIPIDLSEQIPAFPTDKKMATRTASGAVLQQIADILPYVTSGSADLHGSTKNMIQGVGDFDRNNPAGRNFHWGIREHAMGAILNGIAYDGLFRASGATFLTFSDYMRPSVRLAALSKLPVWYIWTHDSVAVGEDGPTHEPVETVSSLRLIPGIDVIRPGDAEETVGAYLAALANHDRPTALILSRQDLPILSEISIESRRNGVLKGAYIAQAEKGQLKCILLATGSELHIALAAAAQLGEGIRVVSMPCWERFERQDQAYRDAVLPPACHKRLSIEAGVTGLWKKYVGDHGISIGIDRFGLSAPGDTVLKTLGISVDHVVEEVQLLLRG